MYICIFYVDVASDWPNFCVCQIIKVFLPKLPFFFTFLYIYNYYVYRPDPDYDARQIHSTDWQSFREVLSVSQLDSLVPPRNQNYRVFFILAMSLSLYSCNATLVHTNKGKVNVWNILVYKVVRSCPPLFLSGGGGNGTDKKNIPLISR